MKNKPYKLTKVKPLDDDSKEIRIGLISDRFKEIMIHMGLDMNDPSLKNTPDRVAKMFINETFKGLYTAPPKITTFPNKGYDQMVIIDKITVNSTCEHHFVPFVGECHIAYIPGKEVCGLSKFSRVVQYFAARPQLQERLTTEIAQFLIETLKTENIAIVMRCKHFCCATRGAKDPNSYTTTSYMGGNFREGSVRAEFLNLIK